MKNYKPFDLGRALAGDEVVTRDGRKVLQLFYFDKASDISERLYALIGWKDDKSGEYYDEITRYNDNGIWFEERESHLDLFLMPKKKKLWIPVSKAQGLHGFYNTDYAYLSEAAARINTDLNTYTIVEVEIDDE